MIACVATPRARRHRTATPDHRSITLTPELKAMLMYEILARTRMREDQHRAHRARLAGRLAAARRWQRLAHFATRRARRVTAHL